MIVGKMGEIDDTQKEINWIAENTPDNNDAKYLLMKSLFVQGKYNQALDVFLKIDINYTYYSESVDLAIQAYIHLKEYNAAWLLGVENNIKYLSYLVELKNNKFTVIAEKTYYVQFLVDETISSDIWPGVMGTINGIKCPLRLDTGADYIVVGLSAAKKLGIELTNQTIGSHAASAIKIWRSTIGSVNITNGPSFKNVPVTILPDLGDYVIFGTNILEPFLTTIDYQKHQFIFTPREKVDMVEKHRNALPANNLKTPFFFMG